MQRILPFVVVAVFGVVAVVALGLQGENATAHRASASTISILRRDFFHDTVVGWLTSGVNRAQFRAELRQRGYTFDGVQEQGGQQVDGFSIPIESGSKLRIPATGFTFLYAPNTDKLIAVSVIQISPTLQERARALAESAVASTDATPTLAHSSRMFNLGTEKLASSHQSLRMMVRMDRLNNEIYSIMYVVSE